VPLELPEAIARQPFRVRLEASSELVAARPQCFRYQRERIRRGWLDCGLYLHRATVVR